MDALDSCSRSSSKNYEQSSSPAISNLDENVGIEVKKTNSINNFNLRSFNVSNNSSKLNILIENLNSSLKSTAQNKEDELDENSNSSIASSSSTNSSTSNSTSSSNHSSLLNEQDESLNSDYNEAVKHDLTNNSTLSAAETLLEIKNFFSKNKNEESKQSNHFDDEDEKEESNLKEAITPKSQNSSIDEEEKVLKELQNDFSENGKF